MAFDNESRVYVSMSAHKNIRYINEGDYLQSVNKFTTLKISRLEQTKGCFFIRDDHGGCIRLGHNAQIATIPKSYTNMIIRYIRDLDYRDIVFKNVQDIKIGDIIMLNCGIRTVKDITFINTTSKMLDIIVDNNDPIYVEGYLVRMKN